MQDFHIFFNVVESSFRILGKALLPRFSLVLEIENFCDVDGLSCLVMLENC